MSAVLLPDASARVADPDEAVRLYGRGYFGTPGADGGLALERAETVYLAEMHRLELRRDGARRPLAWPEVFGRAARAEAGFGVRYLVYRDLRQRGYVVRPSGAPVAFGVLPRGGVPQKTPSRFWVEPVSERRPFELAPVLRLAERARAAKKTLLLAVVDEESDLTYYRVRGLRPSGSLAPHAPPGPAGPEASTGIVADDRVVVFDEAGLERLGRAGGYGTRIGERLELSLLEAVHLAREGRLVLRDARSRRAVTPDRFRRRAERLDSGFRERLAAYTALRERRLVVKTGFKYGAHFRAYPRSPEHAHARYLVRAVADSFAAPWPEIAGHVRVAQGVRKEFVLAAVAISGSVEFVGLERVRP
jgi:tRNA-intron endonuclease